MSYSQFSMKRGIANEDQACKMLQCILRTSRNYGNSESKDGGMANVGGGKEMRGHHGTAGSIGSGGVIISAPRSVGSVGASRNNQQSDKTNKNLINKLSINNGDLGHESQTQVPSARIGCINSSLKANSSSKLLTQAGATHATTTAPASIENTHEKNEDGSSP